MIFILRKRRQITVWKNKVKRLLPVLIVLLVLAIMTGILCITMHAIIRERETSKVSSFSVEEYKLAKPELEKDFLTPNPYSRPQDKLKKVKGVVVHYTANPGTSAQNNRDYFEGLGNKTAKAAKTYASSHFVIGLEGEIIQCLPLSEISYASNERNMDTVSIECCHPDKSGKFKTDTYDSLIELLAWLCTKYDLDTDAIIRHYDVTGKECPKYYVKHEGAWEDLKEDVMDYVKKNGSR